MSNEERPAELATRIVDIVARMNSAPARNADGTLTPFGDSLADELQGVCEAMLTAEGERPDDIMALLWFVTRNADAFLLGIVQDRIDPVTATRLNLGLGKLCEKLQRHFRALPGQYVGAPPPDMKMH